MQYDLRHKTIFTGGNTGIGKAASIPLAELGATVVISCRSQVRGEQVEAEVRHAAKSPEKETRVHTDGMETIFDTNQLGPFLLTHLLLDMLEASAPSPVIYEAKGRFSMASEKWQKLLFGLQLTRWENSKPDVIGMLHVLRSMRTKMPTKTKLKSDFGQ